MKNKLLSILLIFMLGLSISSCGDKVDIIPKDDGEIGGDQEYKADDEYSFVIGDYTYTLRDKRDLIDKQPITLRLQTINEEVLGYGADTYEGSVLRSFNYLGFKMTTFQGSDPDASDWIMEMRTTSPDIYTFRGVKVGDSLKTLIDKYPDLENNEWMKESYIYDPDPEFHNGIQFIVQDDIIIKIIMKTGLDGEPYFTPYDNRSYDENDVKLLYNTRLTADELNLVWQKMTMTQVDIENNHAYTEKNESEDGIDYISDSFEFYFPFDSIDKNPAFITVLKDGNGQFTGPRDISVGDTFDETLAKFPQDNDWETNSAGCFYGDTSYDDSRNEFEGGAVFKDLNGNIDQMVLTTRLLTPFLKIYFKDNVIINYVIVQRLTQ